MEKLFFIRVGGTAMGGVAAACQALGYTVFGSEETLYEPMKSYLQDAGVTVLPVFDPANISESDPDAIIVGNAVSRGNPELEAALIQRRKLVSLPQLICDSLIDKNTSVVIAGTHGKTTTTAMAAWLLEHAGKEPGFMIGGVPGNFPVSCRPAGRTKHNTSEGIFVIEGDEYDTAYFDKRSKFLLYRPDVAVVHNLEFDHADIFENLESIKNSFRLFIRLVPQNGVVLANADDENVLSLLSQGCSPVETYGFSASANWRAAHLVKNQSVTSFDLHKNGEFVVRIEMEIFGDHNVRNMLAACVIALRLGVSPEVVAQGALSFQLPKRRLEVIGTWLGATVFDDFAHHPTAIKETIRALVGRYPGSRILVAFEPRSNSTTRNMFEEDFRHCFEGASGVAFGALDRPWRYTEDERLNTAGLSKELNERGIPAFAVSVEQGKEENWGRYVKTALEEWVQPGDIIALLSNGDFGGLRSEIQADATLIA